MLEDTMPNEVGTPAGDPRSEQLFLSRAGLQSILDRLRSDGFVTVGPTIQQGAILYREIESIDQLPQGWTDDQEAGRYRLKRRDDDALFGFSVGPDSWKQYLFPPVTPLLTSDRENGKWTFREPEGPAAPYAFLGVRACDLAAIRVQDRVFLNGSYEDPHYRDRRDGAFIIAANCTQAARTCFCESMGTGPRCTSGFDLALTEVHDGFVTEIGSDAGRDVLQSGSPRAATQEEIDAAERARQQARAQMHREMDTTDIRNLLLENLDHPRWQETATRCLSCTNCTMVCPTCFCNSVRDRSDLEGDHVERTREWDSCFNREFSYASGGIIRNDIRSRYRQWLTHKLATWHDQFGMSGCVGCGRCITWCPVGIDITEEVAAIRETAS
jgi:formate hydrogenlyase subunit 6/NADH:ubiquinone oxidoreductase subunit I